MTKRIIRVEDSVIEDDFDTFVPEAQVLKEFKITAMTMHRWDNDPDLNFPLPIRIRGRKYRSRKQLQEFKERQFKLAIVNRGKLPKQYENAVAASNALRAAKKAKSASTKRAA